VRHTCRTAGITYEELWRAVAPTLKELLKGHTGRELDALCDQVGITRATVRAYARGAKSPAAWAQRALEEQLGPIRWPELRPKARSRTQAAITTRGRP